MITQIIFCTFLLILLLWRIFRLRIRYWYCLLMERGFKSAIYYDYCYRVFTKLYSDVDAYKVSLAERNEKKIQDDMSFTYGEVIFYNFVQLLEMAKMQPEEIFYDLGSGSGKAVMIAGLVFNSAKACGIEKLETLYDLSNHLVKKLQDLPEGKELLKNQNINILFIHNDFLNEDISDGDVIYINATCFQEPFWSNCLTKLLTLKAGSRVIVLSKDISVGGFKLNHRNMYLMSWGLSQISIYERI